MATEFLIACVLFTIQIIEILRAKILKQILLRLFCRERVGVSLKRLNYERASVHIITSANRNHNSEPITYRRVGSQYILNL